MKIDWKKMAEARGMVFMRGELERVVPVLESIESAYRTLAARIPHEVEPAVVLSEAGVAGE